MEDRLPDLIYKDLVPTRDYLQEVTHVLGNLQRTFLPKDPRDWHYGLEVNVRGITTQPFSVGGKSLRASLDLVRHKVRLAGEAWPLSDNAAPEIYKNIQAWLDTQGAGTNFQLPEFTSKARHFDSHQADCYAAALWWMNQQFTHLKSSLAEGLVSPILLYPHHFDLSLVWFPHADSQQLALGFSSGDETIAEPYLYLTAYPEPPGFTKLAVPKQAYVQTTGFSGIILPYKQLVASPDPRSLFADYAGLLQVARPLMN